MLRQLVDQIRNLTFCTSSARLSAGDIVVPRFFWLQLWRLGECRNRELTDPVAR